MTQLYATYADAMDAIAALKNAGFNDEHISLVGRQDPEAEPATGGAAEGASAGTGIGGGLGAGIGLLAELGMLAMPGISPVVTAGWLASTAAVGVAGAATGGLIGALTDDCVTDDDAHVYEECIRRGGTLVAVRIPEERGDEARQILSAVPTLSSASVPGRIQSHRLAAVRRIRRTVCARRCWNRPWPGRSPDRLALSNHTTHLAKEEED